jgi:serine/threonine-protein kinase
LAVQQTVTSKGLRPFKPSQFGRYTLLMPLSIGGMGEIFLARLEGAQGFEKLCVIKKILPHLAQDPDFVSRFVNEARTLVKLTHGSIAQVLDMGLHQNEPYLALEYIDGKDLRKIIARGRERNLPLPLTFVLFTMSRVLDALAYAHRKRDDDEKEIGLVHRDVSPQNILISYEGEVKVIDFGLAKSTLNASKTNPSIILGKFMYMSPEQARHGKVDRRSDLYCVGLCLYELISGKNPFEDVPPHALMAAVANPQIVHVQQVEPLCPSNIAQIIMRSLSVDPDKRFQTAEELRGKLLACLLEIDPAAGPESCSRFMRETFSAEYGAERKLLSQLRESAPKAEPPTTPVAPAARAPLREVKTGPRIEPPPEDESTPAPTDLRKYGMEPTLPRGKSLQPAALSFAPTPKVGGKEVVAGERETMPGIVVDPLLRATAKGDDDERPTGPHTVDGGVHVTNPNLEEVPTRPVVVQPTSRLPAGIEEPGGPEPVTSQVQVTPDPSEPDLPSVVVSGLSAPGFTPGMLPAPKAAPASAKGTGRLITSPVLMPASQVRAPEVMAPLPKALEKSKPDDNAVTDRGTRSRRTNLLIVLMPLFAVLGLAALVGWTVIRSAANSEEDDNPSPRGKRTMQTPNRPLQNPGIDDEKTEKAAPAPPETQPEAATAATAEDEVTSLTGKDKEQPPPVAAPKKGRGKASEDCSLGVARYFNGVRKGLEPHAANRLQLQIQALENGAKSTPPELQLEKCAKLRTDIQAELK